MSCICVQYIHTLWLMRSEKRKHKIIHCCHLRFYAGSKCKTETAVIVLVTWIYIEFCFLLTADRLHLIIILKWWNLSHRNTYVARDLLDAANEINRFDRISRLIRKKISLLPNHVFCGGNGHFFDAIHNGMPYSFPLLIYLYTYTIHIH